MKRQFDKDKWDATQISVIDQFEQNIIKSANEILDRIQKQSQDNVSKKMEDVSTNAEKAEKSVSSLLDKAKNLAEDGEEESKESLVKIVDSGGTEVVEDFISEKEEARAKEALLQELSMMAKKAADSGDYKQAYKIERAYNEIMFGEEE